MLTGDIMGISRLRVVIVNYRTADLVMKCVASILEHGIATEDDLVVVDNFSPDDSVQKIRSALPNVELIESDTNGGFGSGVNLGAAAVPSQYLLVLNPDTYFESDSVTPTLDFLDRRMDIGILGLDLINPDGTRQYSGRRFYSALDIVARRVKPVANALKDRVDRHLMKKEWDGEGVFDAEWVMGTGFIARSTDFHAIGGMDDRYFLYMEDVDLCARIWQRGKKVCGMPGAQLVHEHQRASAGIAALWSRAGREHMRSLMIFSRKFKLPLYKSPGTEAIIEAYNKSGFAVRTINGVPHPLPVEGEKNKSPTPGGMVDA